MSLRQTNIFLELSHTPHTIPLFNARLSPLAFIKSSAILILFKTSDYTQMKLP